MNPKGEAGARNLSEEEEVSDSPLWKKESLREDSKGLTSCKVKLESGLR